MKLLRNRFNHYIQFCQVTSTYSFQNMFIFFNITKNKEHGSDL